LSQAWGLPGKTIDHHHCRALKLCMQKRKTISKLLG
jgi:hypothetical protein